MILFWIEERARTFDGEGLRRVRLKRNVSQAELANGLRISRQQVSAWERGESQISPDRAVVLLSLLGRDADEVFPVVQ